MKQLRLLLLCASLTALLVRDAAACIPNWRSSGIATLYATVEVREGDVNGDGLTDIAGITRTDARLMLTTAAGFAAATIVASSDYLSDLALADVQNDGKLDLILADTAGNTIRVLPGNGDGTFGAAVTTTLPFSPTRILVLDFTGDGKADVAVRSYSGNTIAILAGDGASHFTELARTALHDFGALAAGDFDDDGVPDLVVPYTDSSRVDVLFGNGDGTFDPAVQLTGGNYAADVAAGDVDGDGDDDFVTADWTDDTMTVVRHTGARAFTITTYDARLGNDTYTDPMAIRLADVTQDGHVDVLLAAVNARAVETFINDGNGTFAEKLVTGVGGTFGGFYSGFPTAVLPGQFTGDSRLDLVVASSYDAKVAMFPNNCGESDVFGSVHTPVISVGQEARVTVYATPPGAGVNYNERLVYPGGTVTIMDGDTELGSAPLGEFGSVTITLTNLPAGEHSLVAVYGGDGNYDPHTSDPFTQKVIAEVTTVTLTLNANLPLTYGDQYTLSAETSFPDGSTPEGYFVLITDGVPSPWLTGPTFFSDWLDAGTHTYQARYTGSSTHPPALSNTVTVTIAQGQIGSYDVWDLTSPVRAGVPVALRVRIFPQNGGTPGGFLRLYEGNTLLDTEDLSNSGWSGANEASFNVPPLPLGTHILRAVYSGDQNFHPYETGDIVVTVLSDTPLPFGVRGGSSITAEWIPLDGASSYTLSRRSGGTWQTIAANMGYWYESYTVPNPQPGVVYALRLQAFDQNANLLQTSVVDVAMLTSFSDDPLATGTKVKAQHISELVQMTNTLRAAGGLAPISLSGAGAGQPITASHLNTLRNAINAGRTAHGAPPVTFTDALTAASTRIKALHLRELRDAFR